MRERRPAKEIRARGKIPYLTIEAAAHVRLYEGLDTRPTRVVGVAHFQPEDSQLGTAHKSSDRLRSPLPSMFGHTAKKVL